MLKIVAPLSAVLLLVSCSGSSGSSSAGADGGSTPTTEFFLDQIPETLTKMLDENSVFTTFVKLVSLTDLAPLFEKDGEITVFVPSNAAFDRLPKGTVDKLEDPKNKEILTRLIAYHMLDGKVPEAEVKAGSMVMKSGDTVNVEVGDQVGYLMNIKMNGIPVLVGDLFGGKSVAHVLADVLIPPGLDLSTL